MTSSLSVRFVGKGGRSLVAEVVHRRIERRIGVDLSLEDVPPTGASLLTDAVHLDLAARALRCARLDAFGRWRRWGGGSPQQLAAATR